MVGRKITIEVGQIYPMEYGFGFGVQHAEVLRILKHSFGAEIEFKLKESGYKSRVSAGAFKLLHLEAITPTQNKDWELPSIEV